MSCKLSIGNFCCSLNFNDCDFDRAVMHYYKEFTCTRTPDAIIEVKVTNRRVPELPETILDCKTVKESHFYFHDRLIEGEWDIDNNHVRIRAPRQLLSERIRLFEQFLTEVYYTWLHLSRFNIGLFGYLIHACAVVRNNQGFVFTGPSGCGKSTIADMLKDGRVLNDEIVLVRSKGESFEVLGTPFTGSFKNNQNTKSILSTVYFLNHSEQNTVKELNTAQAVLQFVKQVIVCKPLVSTNSQKTHRDVFDFALHLVSEVDFCQLFFRKDHHLWMELDRASGIEECDQIREAL